jgi:hypothetical protein
MPQIDDFNPLKPKLVYKVFKHSVCTSKRTAHFAGTKINWLTLFVEVITVYTENLTKLINTKMPGYFLLMSW